LEAIQALAKLSITSSPLHVYGPDIGPIYDALRPLSFLVIDDSTNQLQQFEGMMALTNLASHSPDVASRIANLEGFLSRVELLVFEDHVLLRRASMELVCNLISGSEKVFKRYAGDGNSSQGVKSKLQLVLAMCDVEDLPTRLAASGALATLMSSASPCNLLYELQMEKGRFLPVMKQLLLPPADGGESSEAREDVGSIHRAAICVLNFLTQVENTKLKEAVARYKEQFTELQAVLLDLVKRREAIPIPDQILQCLLQTLKVVVPLLK
jgi:myosin-1